MKSKLYSNFVPFFKIFDFSLSANEMELLNQLDKNERSFKFDMFKGYFFFTNSVLCIGQNGYLLDFICKKLGSLIIQSTHSKHPIKRPISSLVLCH